jgi:hypothetical protein
VIEPLGVVEVNRHVLAERLVAMGDHIKQVADGENVAHRERVALLDQQLHHALRAVRSRCSTLETAINVCTSAGLNG